MDDLNIKQFYVILANFHKLLLFLNFIFLMRSVFLGDIKLNHNLFFFSWLPSLALNLKVKQTLFAGWVGQKSFLAITQHHVAIGWRGGPVGRALDSRSKDRGLEPRSREEHKKNWCSFSESKMLCWLVGVPNTRVSTHARIRMTTYAR